MFDRKDIEKARKTKKVEKVETSLETYYSEAAGTHGYKL